TGMIGRITEMHGTYYAKNYGFGHFFEAKVASGVAEFSERLHDQNNNIWLAIHNDQIIGSVAIDGQDLGNNEAHLRWFILENGYQGSGIGKRL
ncbi:GNAT family N-acetyltransferase, partial [Acinetobacter baumannii]